MHSAVGALGGLGICNGAVFIVKDGKTLNERMCSSKEKNGASFTNISVEEHLTVSHSGSSGQYIGATEPFSTAAKALIGRSTRLTEALKAAAINVGNKAVETSDVAAIKEAAARNRTLGKGGDGKTNLRDVIAEIDVKVSRDRSVTSEDAEAVVEAELSHSVLEHVIPGGVAESVSTAYKLNRNPSL